MNDYLFRKADVFAITELTKRKIAEEVQDFDRDYILKVSEVDLCESLLAKYRFNPPILFTEEAYIKGYGDTDIDVSQDRSRVIFDRSQRYFIKGTSITIAIPFDGDGEMFHLRPSSFSLYIPTGKIYGQELLLNYETISHDEDAFRLTYEGDVKHIEDHLQWLQKDCQEFNALLPSFIEREVKNRKQKLLNDAKLVKALGLPIQRRSQDSLTFTPPEIRRKPSIQQLPKVSKDRFQPEPSLPEEEYKYILKVIENMVLVMERSPRAFVKMNEEALRDHILVQLNGHYEGQATGETFNYAGKTDILIRYEGKNVFIAECKFWKGQKGFLETLDQILGYVSWRDTKTAVIVFNRKRDFTRVLQTLADTVSHHPCYKRELSKPSETHFRFLFHQPSDTNREVYLTVLAFDVPDGNESM
jgi:hypothetical protein